MANELDELTSPVEAGGRDINVIQKQLPVKIGWGSVLFEVLLWVCGILPGIIFIFMKISAANYFRKLQQKLQADADAGKHWERIRDMYPQACEETELLNKLETEKERAERAAHIAEIELAKAKRKFDKASRAAKGKGDGAVGRFDPSDFGLSEQGYALRKTGDELQSLLDRNKAARALAKARRQFEKTSAKSEGERFDPAAYGLDEQGYPLTENKEEKKQ